MAQQKSNLNLMAEVCPSRSGIDEIGEFFQHNFISKKITPKWHVLYVVIFIPKKDFVLQILSNLDNKLEAAYL